MKTRCAGCVDAFDNPGYEALKKGPRNGDRHGAPSLDQTSVLSSKGGRPSGATVHPRAQLRRWQGRSHLRCDRTRSTHTASTDSGDPRGDLRGRTQSAHMSSSALDRALVRRGRGPTWCAHCRVTGAVGHRPNGQVSSVECTARSACGWSRKSLARLTATELLPISSAQGASRARSRSRTRWPFPHRSTHPTDRRGSRRGIARNGVGHLAPPTPD